MFYWLFITLSNKLRFHTIISSMRFITFWNESLSCDTVMVINSTRGWCGCDRMVVGFRTTLICNQCLSPLMLWVRITIRVRCTTLGDKVCLWLGTGRWISPSPMVSSTYKTDRHDTCTTEILLKMVLNTIKQTPIPPISTKWTMNSHWSQKRQPHVRLEIQVLAWDRHKQVAGLN